MKKDETFYKENLEKLKLRRLELKKINQKLKQKFIGIDNQIDAVTRSIETWYTFPELISRPVIVCLWGMTGVGKTDLIRNLVQELKMSEKYIEIQLDPKNYYDTIYQKLKNSNIYSGDSAIMLLDEIQRFRTINDDGTEKEAVAYKDIWELLSDGKISSTTKTQILSSIIEDRYYNEGEDLEDNDEDLDPLDIDENSIGKTPKKNKKYNMSPYCAGKIKELTCTKESIESIMQWSKEKKNQELEKALKSEESVSTDYSKLLIFISGNLDSAFIGSSDVDNVDIDANILHELTKKINFMDIKKNLSFRFRPEQIARFGNNHIVYPSLSESTFKKLIKRKVKDSLNIFKNKSKNFPKIIVDNSVYKSLYVNGVFPSQGTRPIFSTISNIFDNNLPYSFSLALERNIDTIKLSIDDKEKCFVFSNGDNVLLKNKIPLEVSEAKRSISKDVLALQCVHEAGHALLSTLYNKKVPVDVVINRASHLNSAYIMESEKVFHSKESYINYMKVLLAGRIAEDIVFGNDKITNGASSDFYNLSSVLNNYFNKFGFNDYCFYILNSSTPQGDDLVRGKDANRERIEEFSKYIYNEAHKDINNNKNILSDIIKYFKTLQNKEYNPKELTKIFSKYDIKVNILDEDEIDEDGLLGYEDIMNNFLEEN